MLDAVDGPSELVGVADLLPTSGGPATARPPASANCWEPNSPLQHALECRSHSTANGAALDESAHLRRDYGARALYLKAVRARAGTHLAAEVRNPQNAGARWCAAWLLGRDGRPHARRVLASALRSEPVLENVRTIGMILNGDLTCT